MSKFKNLICTSFAVLFVLTALSNVSLRCPIFFYQPELPKKE